MKKRLIVPVILLALCMAGCAAADPDPYVTAQPAQELPRTGPATEEPAGILTEWMALEMPEGDEYAILECGLITFRGNAFRQNAACRETDGAVDRMALEWDYRIPTSDGDPEDGQRFPWTGQPLIVKWSVQVREKSVFLPGFDPPVGMREVIAAEKDGTIHFLNLTTGETARGPLKTGYRLGGGLSLHPGGMPYLCAGRTDGNGEAPLRQFNLYNLEEMEPAGRTGENNGIVSAALIDRTTQILIAAGMDGTLYKIHINPEFDFTEGILRIHPTVLLRRTLTADGAGFLAPVSAMTDRIFCADTAGILRCVQSRTMKTEWEKDLGDTVTAAIALDSRTEGTALYAANTLANRAEGNAAVYCLDALSGEESWRREFGVRKQEGMSGFVASPAVGRKQLDARIYCTAAGLSPEGRKSLGLAGTEESALIALDKETGETVWVYGMAGRCCSSPVAVYDADGTGRIIQCLPDGRIVLLDGKTGTVLDTLQTEGEIEASPAVYRNALVVTSTGKDSGHIYGIRLYAEAEENGGADRP